MSRAQRDRPVMDRMERLERRAAVRRLVTPSLRGLRVWRRNLAQSRRHWHTTVLPPLLEPLLYLLAFGAGLGALVSGLEVAGRPVDYADFIAPALVVITAMNQAFFETTYSSFVRMYYQRIWDAMTATPLNLGDILAGELLWGATKGFFSALIVTGVVLAFGLAEPAGLPALLTAALVSALFFASLGLLFTAVLPSIDAFNFPFFLFVMPMLLFGDTFFPVALLPGWVGRVASFTPLYGMMAVARPATLGMGSATDLLHLLPWLLLLPVAAVAVHLLMARRLID
jgi:lipooligosaccharide transport system permease protein